MSTLEDFKKVKAEVKDINYDQYEPKTQRPRSPYRGKTYAVYLTPPQADILLRLGHGKLSHGIVALLEMAESLSK